MLKNIEHAMIDKGISKKELAELAGMNKQSLYNCFSLGRLSLQTATRLADVLNCDIVLQDRETGKIYK